MIVLNLMLLLLVPAAALGMLTGLDRLEETMFPTVAEPDDEPGAVITPA